MSEHSAASTLLASKRMARNKRHTGLIAHPAYMALFSDGLWVQEELSRIRCTNLYPISPCPAERQQQGQHGCDRTHELLHFYASV